MLGGAAVFGAELSVAFAADEAARVDQEKMRLGALARGPGFQQLAFLAQFGEFVVAQVRGVADPHVHVALVGLGQGAEAAHQKQAVNRPRRIAVAGFVGERAGQALSFGEGLGVGLEVRQPGGRAARDIARQQGMIDVEKQRQQVQHHLLAWRQTLPWRGPCDLR